MSEDIHRTGMRAAIEAAKDASLSDEQRIERAISAYLKAKNEVLVGRPMLTRLYKFFHHAWEGHGSSREEGSFARELLDWRDEVYDFYKTGTPG